MIHIHPNGTGAQGMEKQYPRFLLNVHTSYGVRKVFPEAFGSGYDLLSSMEFEPLPDDPVELWIRNERPVDGANAGG